MGKAIECLRPRIRKKGERRAEKRQDSGDGCHFSSKVLQVNAVVSLILYAFLEWASLSRAEGD